MGPVLRVLGVEVTGLWLVLGLELVGLADVELAPASGAALSLLKVINHQRHDERHHNGHAAQGCGDDRERALLLGQAKNAHHNGEDAAEHADRQPDDRCKTDNHGRAASDDAGQGEAVDLLRLIGRLAIPTPPAP